MTGVLLPVPASWPSVVLAVGLAAAAAALLVAPRVGVPERGRRRPRRGLAVAVAVPGTLLGWSWLGPRELVLVGLAVAVSVVVARSFARGRSRADAERRRGEVLEACEAMAADLAAGQPPVRVLGRAGEEWPDLAPVAAAARVDADVPDALRAAGRLPGAGELRSVAAAWQVAHETGSGLAPAIGRAAAAARSRRRTTRLVAAELAGARATARTLAVLPCLVTLLAYGVGTDPLAFLLGTTPGTVCLALGLALTWLGLTWLERIGDRVLR